MNISHSVHDLVGNTPLLALERYCREKQLPTAILGVVFHGFQAFLVIALSMCSAVVT